MLKSVKINNFKSICDLEIELGRLNVFIGENGCGKTSILEAIGLASGAASNKLDQEFLVSRGIRVTDPKLMKSAFDNASANEDIQLDLRNLNGTYVKYKIGYSNKSIKLVHTDSNMTLNAKGVLNEFLQEYIKDNTITSKFLMPTSDEKEINKNNEAASKLTLAFDTFLKNNYENIKIEDLSVDEDEKAINENLSFKNFLIYTPEDSFLRRFEEEGQINPIGIHGQGLFKHLVELFKSDQNFAKSISENLKLLSWFEGLEIPSDLVFTETRLNIKDRFLKDTIDYFDQRSANEGFLYLLFYFTLFLSNETPKFFAIDNVDNALNPKLCKEFIERLIPLIKQNEKQVILTTHNPSILDGMDLTDDDQRLFVIFRNADGHTKAKRVFSPKFVNGIEPVRLSEAFIRGYLGGLPKNF